MFCGISLAEIASIAQMSAQIRTIDDGKLSKADRVPEWTCTFLLKVHNRRNIFYI